MPQFQSQLGHLAFAKQAAVGTPATIAAAAPTRWMKTRSTSIGGDRSLLIPDPEISGAGGRDIPKVYLSPVSFAGDIEFYVRSEALPLAFYGALGGGGAVPSGTAAAGYTHTFTPADSLPPFTILEKKGDGFDTFQYNDAYFDTLHLEAAADGYMQGTLGVVARTETAGVVNAATPAFDATPLYTGSTISVTFGVTGANTPLPAASFGFDYANNIESDHFVLGSLFVDAMTPKRREVSGSFTLRPEANTYFRQAMYGNSTATTPTGQTTVREMIITCTSYEIITGATTQVYTTRITIPEVILQPFKVEPSGEDTIEHSIDWQAVKVAGANICTVTVINGIATAYNA